MAAPYLRSVIALLACLCVSAGATYAYEPLVEKKTFEIDEFTTWGGETIKGVKVGWEAYGTLNADKSNVILICHFFSGNSHAAGRYAATDVKPGYWNNGDYYGGRPPVRGLAEALKIVTLHGQHWEWANTEYGRKWAKADADPARSLGNHYEIEAELARGAMARAVQSDANHFLYLIKANQLFYAGHGESLLDGLLKIKAPVLIIHTDEDQVFTPEAVRDTAAVIRSTGTPVEIVELQGTNGHLDGLFVITQANNQIRQFLDR